jgi:hypothetical protein
MAQTKLYYDTLVCSVLSNAFAVQIGYFEILLNNELKIIGAK